MDAVFGCKKEIEIDRLATCATCDGSGQKPGTTPTTCTQCNGAGQLISNVRTPLGVFQQLQTCPRCQGRGQMVTPCEKCGGDGRTRTSKKIALTVPAGEYVCGGGGRKAWTVDEAGVRCGAGLVWVGLDRLQEGVGYVKGGPYVKSGYGRYQLLASVP